MPEGPETELTELTVVCGVDRRAAAGVAAALRARHTRTAVLITHDMRALGEGVVRRRVVEDDGEHDAVLELAHACVSCTLRERWGDREQQLVALVHDADPAGLVEALDAALLTDEELALGEVAWRRLPDPFEHRHTDPCPELDTGVESRRGEGWG